MSWAAIVKGGGGGGAEKKEGTKKATAERSEASIERMNATVANLVAFIKRNVTKEDEKKALALLLEFGLVDIFATPNVEFCIRRMLFHLLHEVDESDIIKVLVLRSMVSAEAFNNKTQV